MSPGQMESQGGNGVRPTRFLITILLAILDGSLKTAGSRMPILKKMVGAWPQGDTLLSMFPVVFNLNRDPAVA